MSLMASIVAVCFGLAARKVHPDVSTRSLATAGVFLGTFAVAALALLIVYGWLVVGVFCPAESGCL